MTKVKLDEPNAGDNRQHRSGNVTHSSTQRSGSYRAQELLKVLGDPGRSVQIQATDGLPTNFLHKHS